MVIGNININETIIIIICSSDTHGSSIEVFNAHFLSYICECTVTVVMIKDIGLGIIGQRAWKTVRCVIIFIVGIKIQVLAYIEIKKAVIIVIQPNCSRAEISFFSADTCTFGNVCKCPVPIIFIEYICSIIANIHIGETIVIVIADCNTHTIPWSANTGFLCHVFKSSISAIVIEMILWHYLWFITTAQAFNPGSAAYVQIDKAILIIIEKSSTCAT